MLTSIRLSDSQDYNNCDQGVIFISEKDEISLLPFNKEEKTFLEKMLYTNDKKPFLWAQPKSQTLFVVLQKHKDEDYQLEYARKAGAKAWETLQEWENPKVLYAGSSEFILLAFLEGLMLASYHFDKYKSKKKTTASVLELIHGPEILLPLKELESTIRATFEARDLINEPVSFLDAPQLGKEIQNLGEKYGFETEVFGKAKIGSLKMAGLLAVNAGSKIPPVFAVLRHCPANAKPGNPIVLIGKGIVYDTGGLSLKPTANSMDFMKSDMAGAAAVIGAFCALPALEIPLEVIGLIPITDNRPGYNAMAPGDILTFANGKTVEILNTDAEGRLVLADALIYAKKYHPKLVIDLATLTGSAASAIGELGAVMMGTAEEHYKSSLQESGKEVFERLVEFPLWEEYQEQISSDLADMTNLGGPLGGAITAGKFLENFIDYDWIHLDIAGPSFIKKGKSYLPAGGTGFGVRLLSRFLKRISN